MKTGIIIVDHGSRLADSNRLLEEVAAAFSGRYGAQYDIVEPAHMEIASPSIAEAYGKCVSRGATEIVVVPYFLGPGKHFTQDIPRLACEAACGHPGTHVRMAKFLGLDDHMLEILATRVGESLERPETGLNGISAGERGPESRS